MKIPYVFSVAISLAFTSFSYGQVVPTKDTLSVVKDSLPPAKEMLTIVKDTLSPVKDTLSIVAVGDVMIGSGFPAGNLPKDDALESFKEILVIQKSVGTPRRALVMLFVCLTAMEKSSKRQDLA